MKKLLWNSLIASVVAIAGATTFASQANAQSVDVDFNGTVGNTCEISKESDGTLGLTTDNKGLAANDNMAVVQVNCVGSGSVSVGTPTPTTQADSYSN
ncbi:MAG: hypothetical protein AAFW70_09330 [Cyanobacteria bacterium J06635_10]